MMKLLCCLCFLTVASVFADQSKPFVYHENGKKDPFGPLVSPSGGINTSDFEATSSDIVLEGIVLDAQGKNLAILNGKIVKAGDKILSYTVGTISSNQVELINGQETLTVKIKKGGV